LKPGLGPLLALGEETGIRAQRELGRAQRLQGSRPPQSPDRMPESLCLLTGLVGLPLSNSGPETGRGINMAVTRAEPLTLAQRAVTGFWITSRRAHSSQTRSEAIRTVLSAVNARVVTLELISAKDVDRPS